MKNRYFKCINQRELEKLNSKQKIQHLLDKDLLVETYNSSNMTETDEFGVVETVISLNKDNLEYKFNPELAKEVYEFLLKHYKNAIGADLAFFNIDFKNETFGLSDKKEKKKGLAYFDNYFKLAIGDRQVGLEYDSDGEIVPEKRFKTLYDTRQDFIFNLQDISTLVIDYLLGLEEKFDRKLFETNVQIQNIFRFENNLSILHSLNKRYNIEKENYFTPKSKAEKIYDEYKDNFTSLKQAEFIETFFSQKAKRKQPEINSLYLFMKDELDPDSLSEKQFKEIIVNYFDNDFNSRLKQVADTNQTHIKRIDKLNSDWEKFLI